MGRLVLTHKIVYLHNELKTIANNNNNYCTVNIEDIEGSCEWQYVRCAIC